MSALVRLQRRLGSGVNAKNLRDYAKKGKNSNKQKDSKAAAKPNMGSPHTRQTHIPELGSFHIFTLKIITRQLGNEVFYVFEEPKNGKKWVTIIKKYIMIRG